MSGVQTSSMFLQGFKAVPQSGVAWHRLPFQLSLGQGKGQVEEDKGLGRKSLTSPGQLWPELPRVPH
jgi:hypothetical protein